MFGRYLGIAATLLFFSVATAGIVGRPDMDDRSAPQETGVSGDHRNWTTRDRQSGGSDASQSGPSGEVRLDREGDSHFYADADVDGTSIRMMVDSGASIVALTRRDAEAIGIDVDRLPSAGSAQTAGGVVPLRPVMLDSVEIDGVEVRGVQAAVIDADMGVSLLGQSYLSKLASVKIEGDTMTLR